MLQASQAQHQHQRHGDELEHPLLIVGVVVLGVVVVGFLGVVYRFGGDHSALLNFHNEIILNFNVVNS